MWEMCVLSFALPLYVQIVNKVDRILPLYVQIVNVVGTYESLIYPLPT